MGAVKNMVRGFLFTGLYVVTSIVIPLVIFSLVSNILPFDYENITFWILALGLVISGLAFFKYSSPKQSIRKGVFALLQLLVNCVYIWGYSYSGATEISIVMFDFVFFSLNLQQMVLIFMGIYFLTIVLRVYDIIDFTVNREKIRENRMKE
ncbi:MAG: hypothetical protein ACW986_05715 [Promethearchaeota archaeon]|jgi:hypothetical protein